MTERLTGHLTYRPNVHECDRRYSEQRVGFAVDIWMGHDKKGKPTPEYEVRFCASDKTKERVMKVVYPEIWNICQAIWMKESYVMRSTEGSVELHTVEDGGMKYGV